MILAGKCPRLAQFDSASLKTGHLYFKESLSPLTPRVVYKYALTRVNDDLSKDRHTSSLSCEFPQSILPCEGHYKYIPWPSLPSGPPTRLSLTISRFTYHYLGTSVRNQHVPIHAPDSKTALVS